MRTAADAPGAIASAAGSMARQSHEDTNVTSMEAVPVFRAVKVADTGLSSLIAPRSTVAGISSPAARMAIAETSSSRTAD
jgi:hypothetical protein